MGFDRHFTLGLVGWALLLAAATATAGAAWLTPDLGATRVVTLALVAVAFAGLWHHITRTNRAVAGFLEALRFGDTATVFDRARGAGGAELGRALDETMARLRAGQERTAGELRYLEALVDDMPVALVTVDAERRVTLVNKAARRLFDGSRGSRPEDFAECGASFARKLDGADIGDEVLLLRLGDRPQRVLVRSAMLLRLGLPTRALSVQPIQGTIDAAEVAAQTDLIRVLAHEVLNSLTPVTSLAATAAELLTEAQPGRDPRIDDARVAVSILSRRVQGLGRFIDAYRTVARTPELRRQVFAAGPWTDELARLFSAEASDIPLQLDVEPPGLMIDGDPDLLAQVLINLLRNAAQALEGRQRPRIALRCHAAARATVIEVEDSGPGIPAALKGDVFLPFFTTRATGSGIGLSLARQIVIAHGGAIDLLDSPAGGTIVRILL